MRFSELKRHLFERLNYREYELTGHLAPEKNRHIKSVRPREARTFIFNHLRNGELSQHWSPNIEWDEVEILSWRFVPAKDKGFEDIVVKVRGITKKNVNTIKDFRTKNIPSGSLLYHSTTVVNAKKIERSNRMKIPAKDTQIHHGRVFGRAVYTTPTFGAAKYKWGSNAIVVLKTKRKLKLSHFGDGRMFRDRIDSLTGNLKAAGFDGFYVNSSDEDWTGGTQIGILDPNDLEVVKVLFTPIKHLRNPTNIAQFKVFDSWKSKKEVCVLFSYKSMYVFDTKIPTNDAKITPLFDLMKQNGERTLEYAACYIEMNKEGHPYLRTQWVPYKAVQRIIKLHRRLLDKLGVTVS